MIGASAVADPRICLLGCPGTEVRIFGDRISGLFHLPINGGIPWGYNPTDPNL